MLTITSVLFKLLVIGALWSPRNLWADDIVDYQLGKGAASSVDNDTIHVNNADPNGADSNHSKFNFGSRFKNIIHKNSSMCVDIIRVKGTEDRYIGLWDCDQTEIQKWTYDSETGFIKSKLYPENCLNFVTGQVIALGECNKLARWDHDELVLSSREVPEKCLSLSENKVAKKSERLIVAECQEDRAKLNHEFVIKDALSSAQEEQSSGLIILQNSGFCLSNFENREISIVVCNNSDSQKWNYSRKTGFIRNKLVSTSKCLRHDVNELGTAGYVTLGLCNGQAVWEVDGPRIRSKAQTKMCLDNRNDREKDRNLVITSECRHESSPFASAQNWIFHPEDRIDLVRSASDAGETVKRIKVKDANKCLVSWTGYRYLYIDACEVSEDQEWRYNAQTGHLVKGNQCVRFKAAADQLRGRLVLSNCDNLSRWDIEGEQIKLRANPTMCFDIFDGEMEAGNVVHSKVCRLDPKGRVKSSQRWAISNYSE